MHRIPVLAAVAALCCTKGSHSQDAGADPRLVEAQAVFDEGKKLLASEKYAEALTAAEHALSLREAVLGAMHLQVADCLKLAGEAARLKGEFTRSELLLTRALKIREAGLGKDHLDVASSLGNLAMLYYTQGLYRKSELLYQQSLSIRETALGRNHHDVAVSLNNLAMLSLDQAAYDKAESLFQRSRAIWEVVHGKNHPDVATSLNNLAILYLHQGAYDKAESLFQQSLAIRETALGEDDPDVATSLNNLAMLYRDQGAYDKAEPLFQRSRAVFEAALGKNHPNVAMSLNNLAILYRDQGAYDKAEPLFQRSRAVFEAALGKNHPNVAKSLNNLAELYRNRGLYLQAEPLYQRSLEIREAALGKDHPDVARSLGNIGMLRLGQGRLDDALRLLTRALVLSEGRLRREALDFSESRLADFIKFLRADEERLYAFVREHPDDAGVQRLALAAALLLKGRSVEESANISRAIYRGLSTEDHERFERLRSLRTQLAKLSLDGPGRLSLADYQQRLKGLMEQSDALEADLAKRSAALRALAGLPPATEIVDRVAGSLPRDAALVEFVAYADRPLVPKPGIPPAKIPGQLRYLAMVLFPGARSRAVDLGPAAPIDSAVSRLHDALGGGHGDDSVQRAAEKLYRLTFKPLTPVLGNVRRILLAPDGQLALVPFAALHDGRRYLVDTFDLNYLTSGKDLLLHAEGTPPARSVVVLADPAYDTRPAVGTPSSSSSTTVSPTRADSVERFSSTMRTELANQHWTSLPGTRKEAEAIHRLLPHVQLFLGPNASKAQLLQLQTPGILHVATHGFFLDEAGAPAGTRSKVLSVALGAPAQRPLGPLLRSGLVLAGARVSAAKTEGASSLHPEDTLVTALELSGLNLWGTELVVLSACDTGRGDVRLGQGVYGLRRALAVAGAETLVMSLWRVDDATTADFMERYYQHLIDGKGRGAALREAMLTIRSQEGHSHPRFWAPFISTGADGPLKMPLERSLPRP